VRGHRVVVLGVASPSCTRARARRGLAGRGCLGMAGARLRLGRSGRSVYFQSPAGHGAPLPPYTLLLCGTPTASQPAVTQLRCPAALLALRVLLLLAFARSWA
jgi:hypothetical protein